jgi:AGCS family alanine or glycine:cation symporter
MYMIRKGLHRRWHPLATVYCIFGVVAALGVGNATQVNAVIGGIRSAMCALGCSMSQYWNWVIGVALCVLVGAVLLGGAEKIGSLAEKIVPLAALFYI